MYFFPSCSGSLVKQLLNFPSSRDRNAASGGNSATGPHREAWSTKGSSYADLYTQNVVISMEEQDEQQKQAGEGKTPKERPVWLTQSTVQGAYSESDMLKNRKKISCHSGLITQYLAFTLF